MQKLSQEELTRKALQYAERGIKVFATTGDGKAPSISNKAWSAFLGHEVPRGKGGLHQASMDEKNLRWQFSQRGSGGIGMPCGKVNDVIVADFDVHKEEGGGNAHLKLLEWEDAIENCHRVRTRNGGLHVYFKWASGHGKFELGENIEVQSDGAYVLLPPTRGYRVENMVFREDWDVPPWPGVPNGGGGGWNDERARRELSGETPPEVLAMLSAIRGNGGGWHNAVVGLTAHLVGSGWSDAEILRFVPKWTAAGYTDADTFEEVAVAVAGARRKWEKAGVAETTDQVRIDRFAALWDRCSPAARALIADMVKGAQE